jgi:hypothetical protein
MYNTHVVRNVSNHKGNTLITKLFAKFFSRSTACFETSRVSPKKRSQVDLNLMVLELTLQFHTVPVFSDILHVEPVSRKSICT